MTPYQGRVGADINIALDAVSGDPATVTVTAFMVRSNHLTRFRPEVGFVAIELEVAPRGAAGSIPAGWNVTLPAARSALLKPGLYGIDAVVSGAAGSITITPRTALVDVTAAAVPVPVPVP